MILRRMMRLRRLYWWLSPVIVPSMTLALVFGFISQLEFQEQDRAELQFGNKTSAIYLNEWIRPSTQKASEELVKVGILPAQVNEMCIKIGGLIGVPGDSNAKAGFSEISKNCEYTDFGYTLTSGSWPDSANEAVASEGLFEKGESIVGVAPERLAIVGTVSNKNDHYGRVLLFSEGTWLSWNMEANSALFPSLEATYTVFAEVGDPELLRGEITRLASKAEGAETIEFRDIRDPRSTLLSRFPFLYEWIIWPLSLASIALALALRTRALRTTTQRLVDYGLNRRATQVAILLASGIWVAASLPFGLFLGWGSAAVLEPIAVIVSGHSGGENPPPLELAIKLYSALGIVLLCMIAVTISSAGRFASAERELSPKSRLNGSRLKSWTALCLGSIITVWSFRASNVNELFVLVFLSVTIACWFMPELTRLLSRKLSGDNLGSRYAFRRMASSGSKSWVAAAAATIAFGPFVASAILLSSSVADSNANELLPPRQGQALFYPSGDPAIDQSIKDLVIKCAGSDATFVPVFSPVDELGFGLVATSEGLGAVQSIESTDGLETLLGNKLSKQAKSVLDGGGVIWTKEGHTSEVWKSSRNPKDMFDLDTSMFEAIEPRWANDTSGFVLASTVENLGLKNVLTVWTINGLREPDVTLISSALSVGGFDANYIRFPREENPVSITPFQMGIGSVLGVVGAALLAVALRSSSKQLQVSSRSLILQGMPRGWFRKVFVLEVGATALMGGIVGFVLAFLLLAAGVQSLGIALVVPFEAIIIYSTASFVLFFIMMCISAFQLTKSMSSRG